MSAAELKEQLEIAKQGLKALRDKNSSAVKQLNREIKRLLMKLMRLMKILQK